MKEMSIESIFKLKKEEDAFEKKRKNEYYLERDTNKVLVLENLNCWRLVRD